MKKILVILMLTACVFCTEKKLGGITLGDPYSSVIKKYPQFGSWDNAMQTSFPYPLQVERNTQGLLLQSKDLDLQCYFNRNSKKVEAITAFYNDSRSKDTNVYETGAGLRLFDGIIEMKLLYGTPLDFSEYIYKDVDGQKVTRRIYYYPDMCIQTRKQESMPEFIDVVIIGHYDMNTVVKNKDKKMNQPSYKR